MNRPRYSNFAFDLIIITLCLKIPRKKLKVKHLLTISGVPELPSVWLVLSAVLLLALLLESPRSLLPPSRSSITKSIGILPFKHEMYR